MAAKRLHDLLDSARSQRPALADLARALDDEVARLLAGIAIGREDPVLAGLLGPALTSTVTRAGWNSLVLNPGSTSTKVALYSGLVLLAAEEVRSSAEAGLEARVEQVIAWMQAQRLDPQELSGIAARGGLMAPVRSGSYRICERMLADLAASPIQHPSNLAAPMAARIAQQIGPDVVLTTTDPVMVDEIDPVFRLTGSARITNDGTAVHYLNHRAVARLLVRLSSREPDRLHLISCHMGGGMSAARHRHGRVVQVSQAFSGMPSANRSGSLPLHRVIAEMEAHRYSLEDLRADVMKSGGLLALAGSDDFKAIFELGRRSVGDQREKIELLIEFFADRVAGCILGLSVAEEPLDLVILTGGLARDPDFCRRVSARLHLNVPVVRVPGGLEQSALAAGLLAACADHRSLQDYAEAVEQVAAVREETARLLEVRLFEPPAAACRQWSAPRNLEELIDSACSLEPPAIALVGADNPEALLAVGQAVAHRTADGAPMARFFLVGPYGPVSRLTWELDLAVDDDQVVLVDSRDPVASACELLTAGLAQILMKGSVATAELLKGYLRALKEQAVPHHRLSHLALFDLPGRSKLVGLSDAAMNTYPDVAARIEILDNSIEALRRLGLSRPKVAVLSATEKPSAAVGSSVDAQQIAAHYAGSPDLIIEGPLSLDLAMSPEAVREKHYTGLIQGDADLLLVPDIDVGNAVYKAFTVTSEADAAGVLLGGPAPLVLTSRGDSARTKFASIALAVLLIQRAQPGGVP